MGQLNFTYHKFTTITVRDILFGNILVNVTTALLGHHAKQFKMNSKIRIRLKLSTMVNEYATTQLEFSSSFFIQ